MPRFFFNVRAEGGVARDTTGKELHGLEAPEREAMKLARDWLPDLTPKGPEEQLIVDIADREERTVSRLMVLSRLERL